MKGEQHRKNDEIRSLATKLLANKSQIDDFMKYEKVKKVQKVTQYQTICQQKLKQLVHSTQTSYSKLSKAQRIALEKKIIEKTQIICTTLAMSTNEKLDYLSKGDIDYLIVDEAC